MFIPQNTPQRWRIGLNWLQWGQAISMNFNTSNIKANVVFDGSWNHIHGLVSWATHVAAGGINSGWVYDFDWVNDYIELNDGTPTFYANGFTIMADIKADTIGAIGWRIFDKTFANNGALNGIHLYMGANILRTAINGGSLIDSAGSAITYGTKYRIAVSYDSTGLVTFYVNGAVSWTPASTNPPSQITTTTNARIGNRATATDRAFDWYIGNFRIFSRVLTAAEISADYSALKDARSFVWIPKLTTTLRDAIVSPPNPYQIYNTTASAYQTWNWAAWV